MDATAMKKYTNECKYKIVLNMIKQEAENGYFSIIIRDFYFNDYVEAILINYNYKIEKIKNNTEIKISWE